MKRGLVDSIMVTETVAGLRRLQAVDKFIFTCKDSAWNTSWTLVDMAEEARGCSMGGLEPSSWQRKQFPLRPLVALCVL
jgi:hypothetical protein